MEVVMKEYEEFLEDYLGCDEEYTLDDFFDSYDPD